ncbi:MAG: glycogen/starch/alpha-glucan phosphorylase [Deltaproteobacteria bacterium]|nr:glycogen/starch/alpha-glucan phosphorylase [Deltaproteobacteria bacterium]
MATCNENASVVVEDDRTGRSPETLRRAVLDNLFYIQGKSREIATPNDYYMAVAYTVRDRLLNRWIRTLRAHLETDVKIVCYLSAEFLLGPHLGNNLVNMELLEPMREALAALDLDLDVILAQEEEPGLGNGGLGRLAACYLDSLATLGIPALGFGIRYEHGIFHQDIKDGWQVEKTDNWLHLGNPWEIARPEVEFLVQLGGYTESYVDQEGRYRARWVPERVVKGTPLDTPISGYHTNNCLTLRLWRAEAAESFDFAAFNQGDYYGAVDEKIFSENLTKVLYPNDEALSGKRLRLEQQYFFVTCSLQNVLNMHLRLGNSLLDLARLWVFQLNDTHPSIAVAELMRLLVDEHLLPWEIAWEQTQGCMAYTNHTLLPEALETWPLPLFGEVLPRHLEIIFEINRRFLDEVREHYPHDPEKWSRVSLIDEHGPKAVRMANLACVGSSAINGVAELHTELLRTQLLRDFYELMPQKFSNKTNGVTPRRFLVESNPGLSGLIRGKLGEAWITDLDRLRGLEEFAEDPEFQAAWRSIKRSNKQTLAAVLAPEAGQGLDPEAMFDIQVKRIHEYKRQHLKVLHIITLYHRLRQNPDAIGAPRVFIFGGKAAPGYFMAKLIIKLINAVGETLAADPAVGGKLKVVFVPDYSVKLGQRIFPAADLSEQISTAGMEASGTGNMKFALNGALTIGTLDGANIEIRQEVGEDNFFLFGLTAPEVAQTRAAGYRPWEFAEKDPELAQALKAIAEGEFSGGNGEIFQPLVGQLFTQDPFLVLADYRAYVDCQDRVDQAFQNPTSWTRKSILNVARMGKFSSDRAIREYCRDIWHAAPWTLDF